MATELRNFAAVMLTVLAVGLGIALIGVTRDPPGEGVPGRWHIDDFDQAHYSTVETVTERHGPDHCGWQNVRMLHLHGTAYTDIYGQYVRDPGGVLSRADLQPFKPSVVLPADAERTGWTNGVRELWLTPRGDYVYLARGRVAEAWPRADPIAGCL